MYFAHSERGISIFRAPNSGGLNKHFHHLFTFIAVVRHQICQRFQLSDHRDQDTVVPRFSDAEFKKIICQCHYVVGMDMWIMRQDDRAVWEGK